MDKLNFLQKQKDRLNRLKSNLLPSQEDDFLEKTSRLTNLISILENDKSISKDRLKKQENAIKKELDQMVKDDKEDKEEFLTAIGINKDVKPTDDNIPLEVQEKAKMIEASKTYHNTENFNMAQQVLDQQNIPYQIDPELSNKQGLIIHNPENGDTKAVFRGTRISNLQDLYTDGLIITGQESPETAQFSEAEDMVNRAKQKYGSVDEGLGYSKGSSLNIQTAERTGIPKTTNFNPLIGAKMINPTSQNSKHQLWRTTEDIPSLGVSYLADKDNYELRVVRPKAGSITPKASHDLNQFYGNQTRIKKPTEGDLENRLKKINTTAKRHGEAIMLSDMLADIEGSNRVKLPKDLYNLNRKIKSSAELGNNNLVGHQLDDPLLADTETYDRNQIDHYPATQTDKDGFPIYDPDDFELETRTEDDVMRGLRESDDNLAPRDLPRDVPKLSSKPQIKRKLPNLTKNQKNIFKRVLDRNLKNGEISQERYNFEKGHYIDGENNSHPDMFKWATERSIKSLENLRKTNKKLLDRGKISENEYNKRINNLNTKIAQEKFNGVQKRMSQNNIADIPPSVEAESGGSDITNRGLTYSDWVAQFNSRKGISGGVDTVVNPETGENNIAGGRMTEGSIHHKLWDTATGGDFTEQEQAHFDSLPTVDRDTALTPQEHQEIINATPDERQNIVDRYNDEAIDAIDDHERASSFSEPSEEPRATKSPLMGQLNPIGLGVSFWAGKKASQIANYIDPDGKLLGKKGSSERTSIIGAGAGGISEGILAPLAGSAPEFIPAAIAGAGGAYTGQKSYDILKKVGANELQAQVGAGTIGGASAVGSLLATDVALGTEYGSALGPEGMLIGAGVGGLVATASYFGHQLGIF